MSSSPSEEQLLGYLIEHGPAWVAGQRDRYRPLGRGLSTDEWKSLAPFFTANTLDSVVISRAPLIENPDFYQALAKQGIPPPLDFTPMSAITFVDTVLIASQIVGPQVQQGAAGWKRWTALLFHECVHVCQYRRFGLAVFIERYVKGWAANGRSYHAIPFEAEAYALQARFEAGGETFSVEGAIAA